MVDIFFFVEDGKNNVEFDLVCVICVVCFQCCLCELGGGSGQRPLTPILEVGSTWVEIRSSMLPCAPNFKITNLILLDLLFLSP